MVLSPAQRRHFWRRRGFFLPLHLCSHGQPRHAPEQAQATTQVSLLPLLGSLGQ